LNSTGGIQRKRFYARRALRLLPALAVLLVLVGVFRFLERPPWTTDPIAFVAVIGYVANWVQGFTHVNLGLLSHCWSLAIEEQFYLVWPWLFARKIYSASFVQLLVGGALASAAVRTLLAVPNPRGLDDVTFLRADGLLLGAALAVMVFRDNRIDLVRRFERASAGWACVGLVVAAVAYLALSNAAVPRSIGYFMASVGTTGLIAHVLNRSTSSVSAILRWQVLVGIGRVSYGIYLFHFPVFQWVSHRWSRPVNLLVEYSVTAVIVLVSWYAVESPALRRKARFAVRHPPRAA
jgi:peptidoglycan/LPS O-acetylase OafA/YrhL